MSTRTRAANARWSTWTRHGPLPERSPSNGPARGGWLAGVLCLARWPRHPQPCRQTGPSFDIRGACGYALVPPCGTGSRYRLGHRPSPWSSCRSRPPPDWLLDLLDPPGPAAPGSSRRLGRPRGSLRLAGLGNEPALVVTAGEGRRNDQLNRSLTPLSPGRRWAAVQDDVDHGLTAAGLHVGLQARNYLNPSERRQGRGLR